MNNADAPSTPSDGPLFSDNNSPGTISSGPSPPVSLLPSAKPASSLVIQWLQENYESEEGSSLPRSTLYTHYLQFCAQTNLESINAASFGKLIRSVFPHLKTRRLGTRGHSKYHYYGIRLKPTSKLRVSSLPPKSKPPKKRDLHNPTPSFGAAPKAALESAPLSPSSLNLGVPAGNDVPVGVGGMVGSKQLPDFGMPERSKLPPSLRYEQVQTFMLMYRTHCQRLLDTTAWHSFPDVEKLLRHFWQGMPPHFRPIIQAEPVIDIIVERDLLVYQTVIEQLLPDVLAVLPLSLSQAIREFSRQYVQWLSFAMESLPPALVDRKLLVATDFAHTLRKQACLNHIAQSCRKVLQSPQLVSAMLLDWSRIDFSSISEQTTWLCHSSEDTAQSIQDDFKQFLQQRFGVEQWAQWLSEIINRFLMKCTDLRQLTLTSQQLLLKWSFYASLIIRDLTIRNATSLGSFHLLRTLFDSYLAYLVEQRLAAHELRMTYLGEMGSQTGAPPTATIPPPTFPVHLPEASMDSASSLFPKYHQPHQHATSPIGPAAPSPRPSSPTRTGKHYIPFLPPETVERPAKQIRLDPTHLHSHSVPPPQPDESHAHSVPSSIGQLPPQPQPPPQLQPTSAPAPNPHDLMKPPAVPPHPAYPVSDRISFMGNGMIQTAGGYVLPKAPNMPAGSFIGSAGEYGGPSGIPGPAVSAIRKPSFGSFGSFSSEFSRSLFRSSFDRSRASFDRREGSIDQDSPWQHLLYGLSTPHISFQSFSIDHDHDQENHPPPPKDPSASTHSPTKPESATHNTATNNPAGTNNNSTANTETV